MARGTYFRTRYLDSSIKAVITAVDSFNRVQGNYLDESTLILMCNAFELLGKATLLKLGKSIQSRKYKSQTIPAELVAFRLYDNKEIHQLEYQTVSQLISLRNEATHSFLPPVQNDVMLHLVFGTFKTFRNLIKTHFASSKDEIERNNFLSISFDGTLTYADHAEDLLKKFKKGGADIRRLAYLLERGVAYNGKEYISQEKFERSLINKKGPILSRALFGEYAKKSDLLKVVLVQAPKGYSIDTLIRKGSGKTKEALPVITKKTDINVDYPYSTSQLADKTGKNLSFISKATRKLKLFGDERFHVPISLSKTNSVHKYSDAALAFLKDHFSKNPNFDPYH